MILDSLLGGGRNGVTMHRRSSPQSASAPLSLAAPAPSAAPGQLPAQSREAEGPVFPVEVRSGARAAPRLFSPTFWQLLGIQASFGFCFSTFLLLPKFLATRLDASASQIGLVTALFGVGNLAAIPLVGWLIDRKSRRTLIAGACIVGALASWGFMGVREIGPFVYALRILQGVAFVAVVNSGAALLADCAPQQRLGEALGYWGLAMLLTNAVAPMLVEPIADQRGWDVPFLLAGAAALLTLMFALPLREPARAAPPPRPRPRPQPSPFAARRVALLVVAVIAGSALGSLFTFTQPLALERGMAHVGGYFWGYTAAAIATRLSLGTLADRLGRGRVVTASLLAYGCVALWTADLAPDTLIWMGAGLGVTHGLFYPAFTAFAAEDADPSKRGSVLAYTNGAFNVGFAGSTLVLGYLAQAYGYASVFWVAAVAVFGGVVILIRLPGRAATTRSKKADR